jgi:hypothetical protein
MNEMATLTGTELAELIERVYRSVMRLFGAAATIQHDMGTTATWNPVYDEMSRKADVLAAAAREQHELYRELTAMQRDRIEQAAAAARLSVIDLGDDQTWTAIRDAQAIDAADRRDDPLMKES